MPTDHSNPRSYPNDRPVRGLALVITCVDFRLLDDLVCYLDHENLTNRYYHLAIAGTGLAFADPKGAPIKPGKSAQLELIDRQSWKQLLEDHLVLTLHLTKGKLTDVIVVEHRECGAYRKVLGRDFSDSAESQFQERQLHNYFGLGLIHEIKASAGKLKDAQLQGYAKKIKNFRLLLMDLRGNVERLN